MTRVVLLIVAMTLLTTVGGLKAGTPKKELNITLVVKGSNYTFGTPKQVKKGTFKFDATKKPAQIDLTGPTPEGKTQTIKGHLSLVGRKAGDCR